MARTLEEWKTLTTSEQFEEWEKWNPYSDENLVQLLSEIRDSFLSENPHVSANWGNVHGEYQLVVEMEDSSIPKPYLGIPVRRTPKT